MCVIVDSERNIPSRNQLCQPVMYYVSLHVLNHVVFWQRFERCFFHHQASVNGEVLGIYVSAGGSKCSLDFENSKPSKKPQKHRLKQHDSRQTK